MNSVALNGVFLSDDMVFQSLLFTVLQAKIRSRKKNNIQLSQRRNNMSESQGNNPFEAQINQLVEQMTVREKLGQCIMIEPCFCHAERTGELFNETWESEKDPGYLDLLLNEYHVGTFLFGGASRIDDGSPKAWANYIATVSKHVKTSRLNIPLMYGIDAVHGVNFMKGSTIYTHNLAVAGAWDPELAQQYAGLVAAELSSIGFNLNFAPTIDVARDTRWGRVYESLGEDPYLASQIAGAMVRGMQSPEHMAACAKHFVGYGESRNGMDRTQADLSDRTLLEMHAPPFEAAIEEDVLSIMVSGGDVNGVPVPVSKKLLNSLLRKKMGFTGITMSDWEDVERLHSRHKIAASGKDGIIRAFNAGLDLNMAVCNIAAVDQMEDAIADGEIDMERLDQAVKNVLLTKFKLGLFEQQNIDVDAADAFVGSHKSKQIAKQLAQQSFTLLKNKNDILPLNKNLKAILVTGASANSKRHLCGGWTLGWAGAEENDLDCNTVLDAIRKTASPDAKIVYAPSAEQLESMAVSAEDFDVCISVISEEPHAEWYGDSMELALEEQEDAMLKAAATIGIPMVAVAVLGRPLNIKWLNDKASALLWAYLPGTEGAIPIAETLFGDCNPSGKLPISFPVDGSHVPTLYNARSYESGEISTWYEPLYEFGFGLSYTQFSYGQLSVPETVEQGEPLIATVQVTNTGERSGDEVVQLYLKDLLASVTRPLKSLKGFKRITLAPGESALVSFTLTPELMSLYNEELEFVQEKRPIRLMIAEQSRDFKII